MLTDDDSFQDYQMPFKYFAKPEFLIGEFLRQWGHAHTQDHDPHTEIQTNFGPQMTDVCSTESMDWKKQKVTCGVT